MRKRHGCAGCGKPLTKFGQKKYCSNKCQGVCRQKKVVDNWLAGGKAVKGKMLAMKRGVRNYLIEAANNSCEECGWAGRHPVDGRTLLHIHHIDGDQSNSQRSNLAVLCPNCHSLTHNFGRRNRASKRYKRIYVQVRPRGKVPKGRRKIQRRS